MPAATLGRDAAGLAPRPAPHDAPALRLSALLWLGWVVFVVYGSLLPFDFHPMPLAQALAKFRHVPFYDLGVASRGDWVANGVLYLPVGVLTARLLAVAFGGRAWVAAVLLTLVFGLALATAVEFAQLCFPPRTVSQNDLMAESLGTLVGALVAPWLSPWSRRLRLAMRLGGPRLGWQLLEVYAAAYLLMCFFPYDLLLSVPEWQDRLAGEGWGWLLAPASVQRGWRAGLLLTAEVALMMPFGLLLAGRHGGRRGPGLVAAGLLGCGLGVLIEAGQLAIASGVVQGASVLTRGLGVALGAWLWRQSRRHWPPVGPSASAGPATLSAADRARRIDDLRRRWRPQLLLLTIAYLVLLPAANGWFSRPLQSAAGIAAQWGDLRLMPFFYHYFTTEAEAMFSLGSVAVMYLPVPGLAWALGWRTRTGLIAATVLAPVVETGKLLFGVRPDPTDVLIALAVCFAAQRLAIRLSRDEVNPVPPEAPGPALPALQAPPIAGTSPLAWTVAAFALLLAAASVLDLPALALPVLAVLLAAGLVVLRWPQSALLLVPAALPVFDLAPWTGRFFWDEFDLLLAVTLALAWLRCPPPPPQPRGPWLLPGLLAVSLLVAAARGLMPLQWPDANSFAHYYSGYNALRIVKGGLWAAAFVALYRRLPQPAPARLALFAAGMAIGLALTLAVVLRERLAFVSLLDFGSDYRVTGPFSAMHTGGATIECYLAVATAFALWLALFPPWPRWRWAAAALLPPAGYGLMVTYSRNGFAALALVLVVLLAAALSRKGATLRQRLAALLAGGLLLAAALPVLLGAFAGARLALTGQDLSTRVAHWQDALALRDDGLATALFGVGLGRFPASHYWGSAEPLKAGAYGLVDVAPGARALRLGPGVPIYVEQIVDIPAPGRLRLTLDARASGPATLGVALCEKWLLTSGRCSTADLALQRDGKGWQKLAATLSTADWPPRRWPASRPLKFTLLHRQGSGSIEVGRVRLLDDQGGDLLANGDFSAGFDRWFTSTDVDPPWHIHSLPVTILFETGWFGALAWGLAWLSAIGHAARRSWHGDTAAAVALAALLAITVSGLLNTLIDAPRILFLVLVVLWLARAGGAARRDPSTPGALPAAVRRG